LSMFPALFPFNFFLLLLFPLHPDFTGPNNKDPFFPGQGVKLGRGHVKFMQTVIADLRFTVPFPN